MTEMFKFKAVLLYDGLAVSGRGAGEANTMWKEFWQKWTIDKPAQLGDLLWGVFVVQFAAFLDRLTIRKVIAFIPIVILAVAYHHGIPLPPELMLAGDLLAYLDIVTVVLLVGMLSRAATILFVIKQATARVMSLVNGVTAAMRRLDIRHRRERGSKARKRLLGRPQDEDDECLVTGLAWA
jgi:hypothetical protein